MALNEKQEKFLEVLFEEAEGDFVKAKKLAGYSSSTPTRDIVEALEDEIYAATKRYISTFGPKAVVAMTQILENPTDLGNKEKMAAAKDFLDRGGFKATEKVEVKQVSPIFILPKKADEQE